MAEGETRHLVGLIGNFHVPYNRQLGESLYSKLTSLLENESIKVRDLSPCLCIFHMSSLIALRENGG